MGSLRVRCVDLSATDVPVGTAKELPSFGNRHTTGEGRVTVGDGGVPTHAQGIREWWTRYSIGDGERLRSDGAPQNE